MPVTKKKQNDEDLQYYTTEEVQDQLNNAVIGLLRWERLKDFKAKRGKTLREFSTGLVEALTSEVLIDKDKDGELVIPPAELALALVASAVLVLYEYEIPEKERRKNFLKQLVTV